MIKWFYRLCSKVAGFAASLGIGPYTYYRNDHYIQDGTYLPASMGYGSRYAVGCHFQGIARQIYRAGDVRVEGLLL